MKNHFSIEIAGVNEDLDLVECDYQEGLSQNFSCNVKFLSKNNALVKNILGKNVVISLCVGESARKFQGIITECRVENKSHREIFTYSIQITSLFYFVSQRKNRRAFQGESVVEIVKKICQENAFSNTSFILEKTYVPLRYYVQWDETDFEFLNRMLAELGIFYYFYEKDNEMQWILSDAVAGYQNYSENVDLQNVIYTQNNAEPKFVFSAESHECTLQVGTQFCYEEKWWVITSARHQFKTDEALLMEEDANSAGPGLHGWPGDGSYRASSAAVDHGRWRQDRTREEIVTKNCIFLLKDVGNPEQLCINQFQAIPAEKVFQPALQKIPVVSGIFPAMIAGSSHQKINVDHLGRVQILFPWQADQACTPYMNRLESVSGNNWGAQWIPRVGDAVWVQYLNDHPNFPVVVGAQMLEQHLPVCLPEDENISGFFSFSLQDDSKKQQLIFNDANGEENIALQSESIQYDVHDSFFETIGNDHNIVVHGKLENKTKGKFSLETKKAACFKSQNSELCIDDNAITLHASSFTVGNK